VIVTRFCHEGCGSDRTRKQNDVDSAIKLVFWIVGFHFVPNRYSVEAPRAFEESMMGLELTLSEMGLPGVTLFEQVP